MFKLRNVISNAQIVLRLNVIRRMFFFDYFPYNACKSITKPRGIAK